MATPSYSASNIDVGLDPVTGDLPEVATLINGFDLIIQRVRRRLRTYLGEWLADRSVGLPFFAWIAQKPPDVDAIGASVRAAIETTPGVARVIDWQGAFDTSTRTLTYSCTLQTLQGDARLTIIPLGEPGAGNTNASHRLVIRLVRIAPPA